MQPCIFCKIINREVPSKIIKESFLSIVIQDIHPKAPIHYLILPKIHRPSLAALTPEDAHHAAEILFMAQALAKKQNIPAFRLVSNNGEQVGQSVFHIHFHFLAGKALDF